jgi:hypothetical protein
LLLRRKIYDVKQKGPAPQRSEKASEELLMDTASRRCSLFVDMRLATFSTFGLITLAWTAGCGGDGMASEDPGTSPWESIPADRVAEECGLDSALLKAADDALDFPWAVVRHGKLCHEHYPEGSDASEEVFSATKTLGAVVVGVAAYRTRNLERTGPKTGPLSDDDRVDHWLDAFDFNSDARIAHVLAMIAHNDDLSFGARQYEYDSLGFVQINRLNDIVTAAIAQDPANLGSSVEELTQRHLFGPLGMQDSSWSEGSPDKPFAYYWHTTVRDMARLGLLLLNRGVWNGQRLLAETWVYKMTHPAFEDANTGYGYLTWVHSRSNHVGSEGPERFQGPQDPCTPAALWPTYPHGLSESPDCGYDAPWSCTQQYDSGAWAANGAGGQLIVGHPGLDMVLISKNAGLGAGFGALWSEVRPALVALDPTFRGDEDAFCEAYGNNAYAPDLRR